MCHRFTPLSADETDRVIDYLRAVKHVLDQGMLAEDALPPMAPLGTILLESLDCYPGSECAVVVSGSEPGSLERRTLPWGVEAPWKKGLVFNARIESALRGEGMWREAMEQGRCVVPVRAFYETRNVAAVPASSVAVAAGPSSRRPQYRFASRADQALLLAGLVLGDRFVVVTTEPNATVGAVHNRMPLVLTAPEALGWLEGRLEPQQLLARRFEGALAIEEEAPAAGRKAVPKADADQLSLF